MYDFGSEASGRVPADLTDAASLTRRAAELRARVSGSIALASYLRRIALGESNSDVGIAFVKACAGHGSSWAPRTLPGAAIS
jgi:hypothetical protein